jgi:phage tail-like protein
MARPRFLDLLQVYPFWVFDASGHAGNPLFSIFDPVLGFSACTTPEITIEHRTVQPGNWEYKRRAVKTADVSPITMSRGARFYDSDFFLWVSNAVRGLQPLRRNLVLVHFIGYRPLAAALPGDKGSIFPDEIAVTSLATRIPGRAWFMAGCLPSRYKAGGDFDAMASDVSVQELEVQPEYVHELTIATLSPILGKAFSLAAGTFEAVTSARDF